MIKDNFNRVHDYLRISLTDNCNLRCFYCMPEEDYHFTPSSKLMQAEEIETIAAVFVREGVNKIRLTGGEPLVRKDFANILKRLSTLGVQLTMTTNATRLHEFVDEIKNAGIQSLNISLDTLQKDRFILMTKRDQHEQVMRNIQLMLDNGIGVKVNVVAMKGVNDEEINDFVRWTKDTPIHIRFIEFMPFDGNQWNSDKVITLQEILDKVKTEFDFSSLERNAHETAKNYQVNGHKGTFAVISTMSAPFCGDCNRMRLTADGKMKNCLFSTSETDILTALRNGEDIIPLIHQNISTKKEALGGQFTTDLEKIEAKDLHNRTMISIGG
ncbi:MAG: GTP 3',8-cyclase MoaA [Sediminibacterium sp.]|jgi:GTP 3',8-cyclase